MYGKNISDGTQVKSLNQSNKRILSVRKPNDINLLDKYNNRNLLNKLIKN